MEPEQVLNSLRRAINRRIDHDNVIPDIICSAKMLGGGFPLGAMIMKENIKFEKRTHGSTFGGNLIGCQAGLAVINYMERNNILEYVTETGKDFAMMRKAKKEEVELKEKPADYLELEFNSSRDAAKAYDHINNKLYPTGNQPFNIQPNEGSSLQFEDMDDADKVMAELKKARFK